MISQNLDRNFVLAESKRVIAALRETSRPKMRGMTTAPKVSPPATAADADEAANALEAALAKDLVENSGARCATPQAKKFADENAFISHDPVLSILQTAIDSYFKHEAPHKLISAPAPEHTRAFVARPLGAEKHIAHEGVPLKTRSFQMGDPTKPQGTFEQFSNTDPRWISVEFARLYKLFRGKIAFPKEPTEPVKIGNRARLILVADC